MVIGAGPAGLMAAEQLAEAGHRVLVAEAKPSVGRKFLMAGKSGLNLTKDEPLSQLLTAYGEYEAPLDRIITDFDAAAVQDWADGLGQDIFTGSSRRVFPKVMKASPLLRAWLARLDDHGVQIRTRWRWTGWDGDAHMFDTPDGPQTVRPATTIFAMGGASWARLGSDGAWAPVFRENHIKLTPFQPINMGLTVDWSHHMAPHFGQPIKPLILKAGNQQLRAECTISRTGLEGGGIYAVSKPVRDGAPLYFDLAPDLSEEDIQKRLQTSPKTSLTNRLRKALRLSPAKTALLMEFGRPLPADPASLIKNLPIKHAGPRPMDEAISTSGGVSWDALDENLMLKVRPGTFCAGEMIDWDAPTGGYLITACLATGRRAGQSAARWLQNASRS
nr:TIGR03862 family flavoprotein [Pseudaestuariivita rosea]